MDTIEARTRMLQVARRALEVVLDFQELRYAPVAAQQSIRGMVDEARPLIGDAGYPGERVWSTLHSIEMGFVAYGEPPESEYWIEVSTAMQDAARALDSLLGGAGRDVDFRIVS